MDAIRIVVGEIDVQHIFIVEIFVFLLEVLAVFLKKKINVCGLVGGDIEAAVFVEVADELFCQSFICLDGEITVGTDKLQNLFFLLRGGSSHLCHGEITVGKILV